MMAASRALPGVELVLDRRSRAAPELPRPEGTVVLGDANTVSAPRRHDLAGLPAIACARTGLGEQRCLHGPRRLRRNGCRHNAMACATDIFDAVLNGVAFDAGCGAQIQPKPPFASQNLILRHHRLAQDGEVAQIRPGRRPASSFRRW
jgi:hypothetical protein